MYQSSYESLLTGLLLTASVTYAAWKKTENAPRTTIALVVALFSPLIGAILVLLYKKKKDLVVKPEEEAAPEPAAEEVQEEVARICPHCGAVLKDGAEFCHKCGEKVDE